VVDLTWGINLSGKTSIIILCVLLAFSIYAAYYFNRMPSEVSSYTTVCRYRGEAEFKTVVAVKPSILYDNRTVLQPGEIAYLNLVKQVVVSLQYRFTCDKPINYIRVSYSVEAVLEAEGGWRKTFTLTPGKTVDKPFFEENYTVNMEELTELIRAIEKETGAYASKYTYTVAPHIHVEASTPEGPIDERYEPKISISITGGGAGKRLEFNVLDNSKTGSIVKLERRENTWSFYWLTATVRNMRTLSYAITAVLSTCLGISILRALKTPPPSPIERIKKKYGDTIIESTGFSKIAEEDVVVRVKSIGDLVKASSEAVKPIIHGEEVLEKDGVKTRRHIFYVLDENVRYEYVIEEAEAKPEAAKPVEEAKKTVRLECPYLDKKGGKCGKLAFGHSMEEAYSRLERHVAKDHPDRLEEFKKTYGGR
jgi:hypothetical protein